MSAAAPAGRGCCHWSCSPACERHSRLRFPLPISSSGYLECRSKANTARRRTKPAFAPAHTRGDALHLGQRQTIFREARVNHPHQRIGIALARLKLSHRGGEKKERRNHDQRGETCSVDHGESPLL